MKKIVSLVFTLTIIYSCGNTTYMAEFEKNTNTAKAFFKLHEEENAEAMFEYLHPDIAWHMPVYGMEMGGIEEVKAAILGYQAEFDNMKFNAEYWLPGVNTETGVPDGSTRVYGTWVSTNVKTGKVSTLTSYHSFEFKDGKIISGGDWFDLGGMMNTVGHKNIVIAEFKILPGKQEEVFAAMEDEKIGLNITRNYKGCNSLISTYNDDTNTLWVVSDWDSYDDYNAYLEWRTNEFPALGEALVPLLEGGMKGFRPVFPNSDYKIY
jgi:ketosteroid isomerase-like protein